MHQSCSQKKKEKMFIPQQLSNSLCSRVTIDGKPVYKWATCYTTTELKIDIARILVEEGVLDGIMPRVQETKKLPTLREFILQEYQPTFISNLEQTTHECFCGKV